VPLIACTRPEVSQGQLHRECGTRPEVSQGQLHRECGKCAFMQSTLHGLTSACHSSLAQVTPGHSPLAQPLDTRSSLAHTPGQPDTEKRITCSREPMAASCSELHHSLTPITTHSLAHTHGHSLLAYTCVASQAAEKRITTYTHGQVAAVNFIACSHIWPTLL
jgi:hypothetical protein